MKTILEDSAHRCSQRTSQDLHQLIRQGVAECFPREKARLVVPGVTEGRGEPILAGAQHRVRIDMVGGFEYTLAEIGRGWTKTSRPIRLVRADFYGQFADLHLCQSGIVR